MAEQKPTRARKRQSAAGFTNEERAAMQERARELRAASRRRASASPEDGEADVLAKIAEMEEPDRTMAARLHEVRADFDMRSPPCSRVSRHTAVSITGCAEIGPLRL